MNASDAGLIIATVLALLCLRRRRTGNGVTRQQQNEILMNVDVERKPQA
jgi:hypothetical protein